ncbi:MAG: 1-deoxy-D-xylulose-5-phosphate reductoisomerase, partial [Bacteroidales bacterium]|nr:1-deoxy-D-xylulose-5-phosphate reductoisomerase [Bacteroidales bacterium]
MNKTKKRLGILGSTGSIGTQALEVIAKNRDIFEVDFITANNNVDLLIEQAITFVPNHVVIVNQSNYDLVKDALKAYPTQVHTGCDALNQVVGSDTTDMVLSSLVGFSGLFPTINAVKAGKDVALANKETLVVAGEIITNLARENNVHIYPVDSEHSAIYQCLVGEEENPIEKIYLTASGGPFRGMNAEQLSQVTKAQALNHPNWCMGNKVTIDSASLMNKGLEAIEARWLFDLEPAQIDVIIHAQSIIHSVVQFMDGSMKAQMGLPDMRLPIQYAMGYPRRLKSDFKRFNFMDYPNLTFEKPDLKAFRNLHLAYLAMEKGGNMPCVMNAANEIMVEAFLNDKVKF